MKHSFAAKSDIGCVRQHNEDAYLANEAVGLFAVADGMGGHQGGQYASRMAVQVLDQTMSEHLPALVMPPELSASTNILEAKTPPVSAELDLLCAAFRHACGQIHATAQQDPQLQGMGTTLTAVLVQKGYGFVAHVGDSRCYLWRNQQLLQLTDDHSLVNEHIKSGTMTPEEAQNSRFKNIITRSVGFESDVAVDSLAMQVKPHDVIVLCSDGLTNLVNTSTMADVLQQDVLATVPERLVELAKQAGGDDNITVVCIHIQP